MLSNYILSILAQWDTVTDTQIMQVKEALMPDDDISKIKCRVSSHPATDLYGRMYIAYYDITVFSEDVHVCDIRIDCKSKKAHYTF